jgi:hypothetical protein
MCDSMWKSVERFSKCIYRTLFLCMVLAVGLSISCGRKEEGKLETERVSQTDARQDTSKPDSIAGLRTIYGEFFRLNNSIRSKWSQDDIRKKIEIAEQTRDRVDSICSESGINPQDSAICQKFRNALQKHRERLDKIRDVQDKIEEANETAAEHKAVDEKLAEESKESIFKHSAKARLDNAHAEYMNIKGSLVCVGGIALHPEECPYIALDRIMELK